LPRKADCPFGLTYMTSFFASIALPHWLMIAGTLFLLVGLVGAVLDRRSVEAEPKVAASEPDLFQPPAYESPEEFYDLVAKDQPKDRSAETVDDPAELLLRLAGSNSTSRN